MISGSSNEITFRKADLEDLDCIKRLVDKHKNELGFVVRAALEKSIRISEVVVAVNTDGAIVGFVHYHHRKDGQTTLYNIAIAHTHRRLGIGSGLIDGLIAECRRAKQQSILLKCPVELSANGFYERCGFANASIERGKNRPLNIWRYRL